MKAKLIELWLILECPHCHKPQVRNKSVMHGEVYWFTPVRPINCEYCGQPYTIEADIRRVDEPG